MLSAKVKGDHSRDDQRYVVSGNIATEGEDCKDRNYHEGNNGLYINQFCEVFKNIHTELLSQLGM